ncbi:MAG TPA: ferritin-like domain-containing protein [Patescibacteria group bacterium]|nr:ferritin-like domain-containing protein [Patescibacteria group bacterium]
MDMTKPLLDNIEPEIVEQLTSRRNSLAAMGKLGLAVAAMGSLPALLAATTTKAYGSVKRSPQAVIDVLNYALTLEILERDFYQKAVSANNAGTLNVGNDLPVFTQILKHEAAHVALLQGFNATALNLGGEIKFDKVFTDVFKNYDLFKAVAQSLEDTGVRAYKGRAAELINDKATLTVALQIHSVEARHAAMIRRLRGLRGWIVGAEANGGAPEVYGGEDATNGNFSIGGTAPSESFDEPLTPEAVVATVQKYFVV